MLKSGKRAIACNPRHHNNRICAMASRVKMSNPKGLAKPAGAYSHVARATAGDLLFVAGQVPVNAAGKLVGAGDFEAQARQVYRNIGIALKSAGAGYGNIVQFTTYLVDSRDIAKLRKFREQNFKKYFTDGQYPPNTLLVVDRLASEEIRLEVAAIAVL
jgi:enamine deaminase RidA (YjgF/YER057c/UK114 family)